MWPTLVTSKEDLPVTEPLDVCVDSYAAQILVETISEYNADNEFEEKISVSLYGAAIGEVQLDSILKNTKNKWSRDGIVSKYARETPDVLVVVFHYRTSLWSRGVRAVSVRATKSLGQTLLTGRPHDSTGAAAWEK